MDGPSRAGPDPINFNKKYYFADVYIFWMGRLGPSILGPAIQTPCPMDGPGLSSLIVSFKEILHMDGN